jgi:hypothetical protein
MGSKCKIIMNMTSGAAAFLITGCTFSSDFQSEVDRNLISPWRNYHYTLSDFWHFRTQEDMQNYGWSIIRGYRNFGLYCLYFGNKKFE